MTYENVTGWRGKKHSWEAQSYTKEEARQASFWQMGYGACVQIVALELIFVKKFTELVLRFAHLLFNIKVV